MISFSFMALFLIHVLIHKFIDSNSKSPQDSLTLFLSTCNKFYCGQKSTLFINFICYLKILCKGFDHIHLPSSSNIHRPSPSTQLYVPIFKLIKTNLCCPYVLGYIIYHQTVVELTRTTLLR